MHCSYHRTFTLFFIQNKIANCIYVNNVTIAINCIRRINQPNYFMCNNRIIELTIHSAHHDVAS